MNEIKELIIKILEESPDIAIWVLVIIYGYKIAFVGTIFGLIKFSIKKICDTIAKLQAKSLDSELEESRAPKEWDCGDGIVVNEAAALELKVLLSLIKEKGPGLNSYVHGSEIIRCRLAYEKSLQDEKS